MMATIPTSRGDENNPDDNNTYVVVVRATEVLPEDAEGTAKYDEILVRVNVQNVDEEGMASIDWRQPQVDRGIDCLWQRS